MGSFSQLLKTAVRNALDPPKWDENPLLAVGLSLEIVKKFPADEHGQNSLRSFIRSYVRLVTATFHTDRPDNPSGDLLKFTAALQVLKDEGNFQRALAEFLQFANDPLWAARAIEHRNEELKRENHELREALNAAQQQLGALKIAESNLRIARDELEQLNVRNKTLRRELDSKTATIAAYERGEGRLDLRLKASQAQLANLDKIVALSKERANLVVNLARRFAMGAVSPRILRSAPKTLKAADLVTGVYAFRVRLVASSKGLSGSRDVELIGWDTKGDLPVIRTHPERSQPDLLVEATALPPEIKRAFNAACDGVKKGVAAVCPMVHQLSIEPVFLPVKQGLVVTNELMPEGVRKMVAGRVAFDGKRWRILGSVAAVPPSRVKLEEIRRDPPPVLGLPIDSVAVLANLIPGQVAIGRFLVMAPCFELRTKAVREEAEQSEVTFMLPTTNVPLNVGYYVVAIA